MGLTSEIASSVGIRVYRNGPMELVASADLGRFLEEVRTRGLRVLGLEGFRIVGSSLVPEMDAIADLSAIPCSAASEDTVDEALQFLCDVASLNLFYEVSFADRPG